MAAPLSIDTPRPLRFVIRDLSTRDLKVILHAVHTNLAQVIAEEITRRRLEATVRQGDI